jgi:hypothetical protein
MTEQEKGKESSSENSVLSSPTTGPLIFISHDSRDAELAEAFSKLLRSVSAGMIKSFRSSDKKGTEGIEFGDEWYKRLMTKLQSASDVVCLFTERSLDRPWILFEAGVAKGTLKAPVHGIALGVPLGRVSTGPFYQFQNCDDSEADLTKLVQQLARRVPGIELDQDVLKTQVVAFKNAVEQILKKLAPHDKTGEKATEEENPIAKLVEEMKTLPARVAERLTEFGDPYRKRRLRRFHPMMFEEISRMTEDPTDPVVILMVASLIRDDAPWLYELAMEVYNAVKSGDYVKIEKEMDRLHRFSRGMMREPFMGEFGFLSSKEAHMFCMEFPRMLEHMLERSLGDKKITLKKRPRPTSE